jgi:CubicO group peptidase (beta-lactamase class C family)
MGNCTWRLLAHHFTNHEVGRLQSLANALSLIDEWVGPQGVPGVGAAVWANGEVVAERYVGLADAERPVTAETLFPMASVTKPITATTVMSLVEQGLLSLDEPVGRLVPEFRAGPRPDGVDISPELERLRPTISARQLLCHVSGLPEDLGPRESRYQDRATIDEVIDLMCRLPLLSAPGDTLRYSNAGYGVLARLVERITERPFWEVTQSEVFQPLGLAEIAPNPRGDQLNRVANLADSSHEGTELETYNGAYWRGLALPWGGLFGTPRAAVTFAGAFLDGEALSSASISLMTHDQTNGVPGGVESARIRWNPGRWGLGWEVKGEKRRHWTGELTSPRTYCHFGHAGTLLWADPDTGVALAVFSNRAVTHMWSFILARWARLSNAVVAAVGL